MNATADNRKETLVSIVSRPPGWRSADRAAWNAAREELLELERLERLATGDQINITFDDERLGTH